MGMITLKYCNRLIIHTRLHREILLNRLLINYTHFCEYNRLRGVLSE